MPCRIVYMIPMFMCTHVRANPLLDKHSGALCPRLHKDLAFSKMRWQRVRIKQKKTSRLRSDRKCIRLLGVFGNEGLRGWKPPTRRAEGFGATRRGSEPHQNAGKLMSVANLFPSTSSETSCLRWYPRCIQCLAALFFGTNLQRWCFAPSIRVLGWSSHL